MLELGAPARLVVPEGLLVDETVRERMERRLASAPADVGGIAARIADLAPGASYRVHVEWAALDAPWPGAAAPDVMSTAPLRGAVLLRPAVEYAVRDGAVEVAGSLLVDPGSFAHAPSSAIGALQPASERGRPPFPRRPVVVFLGCEPGGDGDWVRRLVNRLVRTNVEARIAMPDVAPGVHLTRPSLPNEATIRALAPDVVVTLDDCAAAQVDQWCEGDRSTVVVAFDPALADPMELVSWQIGRAAGRLRARIGPWVDVVAFASLVGRLCAGPHPIAPSEPQLLDIRTPVREHWTTDAPLDAASPIPTAGCVVVTGAIDPAASARVAGLADNLEAAGVSVDIARNPDAPAARRANVVVLVGVASGPQVDALIADRRVAGLPTVVDLRSADIESTPRDDDADRESTLTESAAAIVEACGLAIAPSGGLGAIAAQVARRALVVPTLLPRARVASLRGARVPPFEPGAPLVIGWRTTAGDDPLHAYEQAVAEGILMTLEDRRNRVAVVGEAADVPAILRGHERVAVVPERALDAETIAGWAVHVWTPALLRDEIVDDARVYEEASCAGVASVLPAAARGGVDGYVSPFVIVQTVNDAEEWANALHHVLDDGRVREKRREEAQRRADSVDSAAASKAVVSRLAGWAQYGSRSAVAR